MKRISFALLMIFSIIVGACTTESVPQQDPTIVPGTNAPTELLVVSNVPLPETDQIIFTIPNTEPWSGREGEPRPNWLGWGAETFAVAPDGTFWIADNAANPGRLLHYDSQGELLKEISLQDIVVYAYDIVVTPESVWILDVSSQQPKVLQLSLQGEVLSSGDIDEQIMMSDGYPVSNGVSKLFFGESGQLLLFGINGYFELIDPAGKVVTRPLDNIAYYGHTYEIGIYDEATARLPIYVNGDPLEISSDFFVEAPFLGFNPDGSFAIAGQVQRADGRADWQVRYYDAAGGWLSTARQRPQTFYKDFNHHLAFGPDGLVYQLLSNPDHSVQVLRLGFSAELPPLGDLPMLTPTPLTALKPSESATTDEEQARNALLTFFDNLSAGNYAEAAPYFGGVFGEYARAQEPDESISAYWEYVCTTVLWCLPVADITDTEQVSENEFIFHVVFMHPDGTRFMIGACCGGDPAATPPVWQFAYPVQKIDGVWKVMREPLFTP